MRQRIRVILGAGAVAAAFALLAGPAPAHSGFTLPAAQLTTAAPVLDGVMNTGEWGSASTFVFPAGADDGQVWAMHDGEYVYFAFRRIDATPGTSAAFQVYFDNAHNGALDQGDDAWSIGVNPTTSASSTNDAFYQPDSCPSCWPDDVAFAGTNDVQGGAAYTAGTGEVVFEMRHPRCTADGTHDICLPADGTLAGITFLYFSGSSTVFYPSSFAAPAEFGDFSLVPPSGGGAPETTIVSGPSDYELVATGSFAFSSSVEGSSFGCSLDGTPPSPCTSPFAFGPLADGPHRFEVQAFNAGVPDATPAYRLWTVDTVASAGTLDRHNGAVTSTSGGRSIGGPARNEMAQIFSPSSTSTLAEVRVGLSCPTAQSVRARIEQTTAGVPNGTILATADVTDAGPSPAFKRFPFSPAPTLTAGTSYAIVVSGPSVAGCFTYIAEDLTPGGVYFRDAEPATAWAPNEAAEDLAFATFVTAAAAPSFVVTNTNDVGAGSLRQAIVDASAAPGADTITFAIPGSGPHTIVLASPLPDLVGPVTIDGTSQNGFVGTPLIELRGDSSFTGLKLTGTGAIVRSLALYGFHNGVELAGSSGRLVGSFVGLDGTRIVRGNANIGVIVSGGTSNEVGGAADLDQNVISGNAGNGVVVTGASQTSIRKNLVGTNATGTLAAPNGTNGILVNPGSTTTSIVENVVSGNVNDGVFVHPQANVVANRIGVALSSDASIPNGGDGVQLNGSGSNVGDDAAGSANLIASNGAAGVLVSGGASNRITGNSIHSNGGLGIDLAPTGVTPNDGEDTDAGPNDLQNFPVLERVELATGSTDHVNILATVDAGASGTYRIDYYANIACDGSGNGEGARHLGRDLAAAVGPNVSFDSSSFGPVGSGELITATITSPNGSTSEFSECYPIGEDPGDLAFTSPADCVPGFLGGHTIDFEDAPNGTVLAEFYAKLGVHFVDGIDSTPRASSSTARLTSSPPTSLVNDPDDIEGEITSDDVPLRMTFDQPQRAVGFFLGNGDAFVDATVTASQDGVPLGTVSIAVPSDDVTKFIGIRLSEGTFTELELDYGGSPLEEEIDDLCFVTTDDVGEVSGAITLTSDEKFVPAGVKLAPLASVPSNQLPSFAGSPSSAPVGSIPVGSIPVGSIPVGSIPVGSIPVGSIPVGSIPVGSIPVGSIPVGSIGLSAVPVGSIGLDQILLSMLPVNADELLAGTPLADHPRQSITLGDVYANATTRTRFNALMLPESGLMSSILNGVPFSAFLLGRATLSQLPPPDSSTWCGAITTAGGSCNGVTGSNTVVGLSIAGVPVGSIPVGSIPVGSIPVGSIPVGSIPVGSIDLEASRLAGIPVGSISDANKPHVLTCELSCPADWKLRDAKAAGAIKPGAELRHLVGAFPSGLVLNDLILGIVPRSALAWESFPIDGFQLFAGTGDTVRYRLRFTLSCPVPSDFAARVRLPDGWLYKPGTTRWQYGTTATPIAGADPSTSSRAGARWSVLPGTPCPTGATSREVELSFQALAGLTIGSHEAEGSVTMGGATNAATGSPSVLVNQNWESNDAPENAPEIQKDRLVVGHVASEGDREVFRLAVPSVRGTRTTVYLSHIAEDADFDLVIGKPEAPSLQSSPVGSIPVGSIPVEDGGSSVNNSGESLPPETLQDIPVGSIPVGSISANRGSADEAAQVVADGEQGFYTIVVSGYNGSHSDQPFVLRVVQTPPATLPPCPQRNLTLGAAGTLPGAVSGAETLFVVNRQRLAALYPGHNLDAMYQALGDVAATVNGQILEVDGSADVRAKYAAWDQSPCSIDAANDVVRAINDTIAPYRAAAKYVVLLGTDEAIPMMRRLDPVTISNETEEAPDLFFTLNNGNANALYAAAARGYYLSDTVYGAFTSVPWLGRDLYLPNIPVGRVVETPTDIRRQLELYRDAGGVLDAKSTVTTAYDFLTDGGQAVADGVAGLAGPHESLINDTWNAASVIPKLTSPADVLSVNAHYSHWLLQPAAGTALVSTGDLPAVEDAFAHRILFTMGCHGGLNVADTLLSSPTAFQQARLRDWTQAFSQKRAAVFVANTGFGYGDTEANALSERLMSLFATKLPQKGSIGERWLDAVHEYFGSAGVYGVYDEKALTEATFYGLPFWSLGTASTPVPPSIPPATPDPLGFSVAPVTVTPSATEHLPQSPRGRFWEGPGKQTLAIHYRPIQPRVVVDVTQPGLVATGAMITSLQTHDVGPVDPVNATPTIDLAANEPERKFREQIFPANLVSLTRSRGPAGDRQRAVVIAGQFRPGATPGAGTERLVDQIGLQVAYKAAPTDSTPPLIEQVAAVHTSSATIAVRVREDAPDGVKRVAALYSAGGSGVITWQFVELVDAGNGLWITNPAVAATGPIQVIAMAQNADGLVGYSANKGVNFPSVTDASGPEVTLGAPAPGAEYFLNEQVPVSFACSDAGIVASCQGAPILPGNLLDTQTVGSKTFTVTATDLANNTTTLPIQYRVIYRFTGFFEPISAPPTLNQVKAGRAVPLRFSLAGNQGLNIFAAGYPSSVQIACDTSAPVESDVPTSTAGSSSLVYESGTDRYLYMWKTETSWVNTCRRLLFKFADGKERYVDFKFTR